MVLSLDHNLNKVHYSLAGLIYLYLTITVLNNIIY